MFHARHTGIFNTMLARLVWAGDDRTEPKRRMFVKFAHDTFDPARSIANRSICKTQPKTSMSVSHTAHIAHSNGKPYSSELGAHNRGRNDEGKNGKLKSAIAKRLKSVECVLVEVCFLFLLTMSFVRFFFAATWLARTPKTARNRLEQRYF